MSGDRQFEGLTDQMAAARAAVPPARVTLDDCKRTLAMLRTTAVVDRATHIRNYEYLIAEIEELGRYAGGVGKRRR